MPLHERSFDSARAILFVDKACRGVKVVLSLFFTQMWTDYDLEDPVYTLIIARERPFGPFDRLTPGLAAGSTLSIMLPNTTPRRSNRKIL